MHAYHFDKFKLIPVTIEDYLIFQNMAMFYMYDVSSFFPAEPGWEIADNGLYESGIDFRKYWENPSTKQYLIRYDLELCGFAIVEQQGSSDADVFKMEQFFIVRRFQGKGVGRYIARKIFQKHKGTWEVSVIPGNKGAYFFWKKIIQELTPRYVEEKMDVSGDERIIFKFDARLVFGDI